MTNAPPTFSARPSATGYLYQIQLALLLLLEASEESGVILEVLDDVSFHDEGSPIELIQVKHHCSREATLADSSADLWKTLRVWSERLLAGQINLPGVSLSLITTASAAEGSIAAGLRQGSTVDREELRIRLAAVAQSSENVALKPAFESFRALGEDGQQALVNSIYVLDNAPSLDQVQTEIRRKLGLGIRAEHLPRVHERLDGWWLEQAIVHLRAGTGTPSPITRFEAASKIADIADEYRPDSLPIEFEEARPTSGVDPDSDSRMFVRQLREIGVGTKRIEKAILDYYRATQQRSKWVREDLLVDSELQRYERQLVDEWERFSQACIEKLTEHQLKVEAELQKCGKTIFDHFDLEAELKIRPRVTAAYIMRGSFHMLADLLPPKVHWHPQFLERVKELLTESGS